MNSLLTFIASFLFLAGCGSSLKKELVANPTTQEDKDKNAIIEYAMTNGWKNVQSTESGIYYTLENPGDGNGSPSMTDQITAHYHGTLLNGDVFDSSVDRGQPFSFKLGGVVKGWQQSIPLLSKGGKGKFLIPSGLAYGSRGSGGKIPPNSPLMFEIELIDFEDPSVAEAARVGEQDKAIMEYATANNLKLEKTEKGVFYMIEKEGNGKDFPDISNTLKVHYHGTLLDGTVFDSSVDRGESIEFPLGRVIPGWQDAIPLLSKGGKGKFIIPSRLAYGGRPAGKIPPHSILIFDVELIDFK